MTIAKKVSESISSLIEKTASSIDEQTDIATIQKNHSFNNNPLSFALAKGKTFKDDIYITPNTKLKGGLKDMKDLAIGTVIQVIYDNTSRGYEAKQVSIHGKKNEDESDLDIIASALHNDENADDEELIDLLAGDTSVPREKLAKLIKAERQKFLRGDYIKNKTTDDHVIIKKYV